MTATAELPLTPVLNNVLLRRVKPEEMTKGGIYVPPTARDDGQDAWLAEVLAIGPGKPVESTVSDGEIDVIPVFTVKPGDRCYVPAFNGYKVRLGGQDFLLVKDTDILAKVTA